MAESFEAVARLRHADLIAELRELENSTMGGPIKRARVALEAADQREEQARKALDGARYGQTGNGEPCWCADLLQGQHSPECVAAREALAAMDRSEP